jgi:Alpha/beta hydrolase domain
MERHRDLRRLAPFALLFVLACSPGHAAAQGTPRGTPVPTARGPVPGTAKSYPLMAAATLQNVIDLPKFGYVEEEWFISGLANVYDWDAIGGLSVRTAAAPYTTRILVRRPADANRFSGAVIVELSNTGRRYDFSFTWGLAHEGFMESGDVWVALTYTPDTIAGLKAFNPTRYAPLGMANPTPAARCANGDSSPTEEGLRWDMVSQVGAVLKSKAPGTPLAGFNVERVYATSHGGELPTYIAAVHPYATLPTGRPVYDGYLVHRHTNMTRMHRCATAPAPDDPRQVLRDVTVPVIRIVSQTDVLGTHARRRDDSDAAGDRYRLYEVAGAPHADEAFYRYIPSLADQKAAGTDPFLAFWPFPNQCEPEIALMKLPVMQYVVNAAFRHLDRWVRDSVPPPRAPRIALQNAGTPQVRVATDEHGNALGGVRSPYVDVPVATYFASTGGEGLCGNLGHMAPFDWAKLERLYGSSKSYASTLALSVDKLVKERWLTEADGRKITAAVTPPPSSR